MSSGFPLGIELGVIAIVLAMSWVQLSVYYLFKQWNHYRQRDIAQGIPLHRFLLVDCTLVSRAT